MKKYVMNGVTFTLKRKTISDHIISREDAIENYKEFISGYTNLSMLDVQEIPMEKEDFVDFVLSKYSISEKQSFISLNNNFIRKAATVESFFIRVLLTLGYKATELLNLTHAELFNVFTYEFYYKICVAHPEKARAIIEDLVKFGIDLNDATTYVNNGLPQEEVVEEKKTTEKEDMENILKSLKENN